jgi:DNA topoisomerase-1
MGDVMDDLHPIPSQHEIAEIPADAALHCQVGGLTYVDDRLPGISRKIVRKHFQYFDPSGQRITDQAEIKRINALVIPPAYTNVWICPDPDGHIQATGRDARGRKQYRYHPRWHEVRDANKYEQLSEFGHALPRIRKHVDASLASSGLSQEKVMAVVVRLLETTLIRIGTSRYAKVNRSYGLTTMRRQHASVQGGRIRFKFRGKSGVEHDVTLTDRRVANIVKRCMEIPGHDLFHYRDDDGTIRHIDSGTVNAYLREVGKGEFTAKHFRTWGGSVIALAALQRIPFTSADDARKVVVAVIKDVAKRLGNTPAVCRSCYIHPAIIDAYLRGDMPPPPKLASPRGLSIDERRLLHFLESSQAQS